jgi:hypothetical protein
MDKIRPKHYQHPSGVECIDVAIHHDFCIGNVMKYLWRAGQKDNETELEDLLKAQEYLTFKINQLNGTHHNGGLLDRGKPKRQTIKTDIRKSDGNSGLAKLSPYPFNQ